MVTRPSAHLAAALGVLTTVIAGIACAQVETEFTPGLFVGVNYSDNLRLQPDDQAISQLTYIFTPEITFSRDGPRMQTRLNYRAQGIVNDAESRDDSVLSFLRFNNNATLVENSLFFDIATNITQQIVDPGQAVPVSGINGLGNVNEVLTAFATPRWESAVGGFAQSTLTYQAGIVEYGDPALRDSKESRWNYSLNGILGRNSSWLISYSDASIEYDTREEVDLSTLTAELGIGIGAKTALVLTGGYDSNSFSNPFGAQDIEDDFWLVGLRGTFGRFTEYDIRGGQRFFGDTYSVNISRQKGNLTGVIDYSEQVTTAGQAQIDFRSLFEFVSDITGEELPVAVPNAYVRKRLQFSGDWQLDTGVVTIAVFDEERLFLDLLSGDNNEHVVGSSASYSWTAGARTSVNVDVSWRRFELRNSNDTPEDIRVQLRARREFGNDYSLNVAMWRNQRDATEPENKFTENAASVGLSKRF